MSQQDLRPDPKVLLWATAAIAVVSVATLPWPEAVASVVLGVLMVAGADIDARTYLLPDLVTGGAVVCAILAAPLLDRFDPWLSLAAAVARAAGTAFVLALVRWAYARLRGREGIGLGDIKLAAATGAWLPVEAIPLCFALATGGALVAVLLARLRGEDIDPAAKVPFGAFLCPALWFTFYGITLRG